MLILNICINIDIIINMSDSTDIVINDEVEDLNDVEIVVYESTESISHDKSELFDQLREENLFSDNIVNSLFELNNQLVGQFIPASNLDSILCKSLLNYYIPILSDQQLLTYAQSENRESSNYLVTVQTDNTIIALKEINTTSIFASKDVSLLKSSDIVKPSDIEYTTVNMPAKSTFSIKGFYIKKNLEIPVIMQNFSKIYNTDSLILSGNYTLYNSINNTYISQTIQNSTCHFTKLLNSKDLVIIFDDKESASIKMQLLLNVIKLRYNYYANSTKNFLYEVAKCVKSLQMNHVIKSPINTIDQIFNFKYSNLQELYSILDKSGLLPYHYLKEFLPQSEEFIHIDKMVKEYFIKKAEQKATLIENINKKLIIQKKEQIAYIKFHKKLINLSKKEFELVNIIYNNNEDLRNLDENNPLVKLDYAVKYLSNREIAKLIKLTKPLFAASNHKVLHGICYHVLLMGQLMITHKNTNKMIQNELKSSITIYDVDGYYCKYCGEILIPITEEVSQYDENSSYETISKISKSIWMQTLFIFNTSVKFDASISTKQLVIYITSSITNIINDVELSLLKNKSNTEEKINDTISLHIDIYVYAILAVLIVKDKHIRFLNQTKTDEVAIINHAFTLLFKSKEPVVNRLDLTKEVVKSTFIKAYSWSKQYISPLKQNKTNDVINSLSNNATYLYLKNYALTHNMSTTDKAILGKEYTLTPSIGKFNSRVIDKKMFFEMTFDNISNASDSFLNKVNKDFDNDNDNFINISKSDLTLYKNVSYAQFVEYIKDAIYHTDAVPIDPRRQLYYEKYANVQNLEASVKQYMISQNCNGIFQYIEKDFKSFNNIQINKFYCPSGSKHIIKQLVYIDKNKVEHIYDIKDVKKSYNETLIDKICGICNNRVINIKSDNRTLNDLYDIIYKKAFFTYFKERCPEGNLHSLAGNKCNKCGYNLEIITHEKNGMAYYNKYKHTFEELQEEKYEILVEQIDKLSSFGIDNISSSMSFNDNKISNKISSKIDNKLDNKLSIKPITIEKINAKLLHNDDLLTLSNKSFKLDNVNKYVKLSGIKYNVIINIGLSEGLKYANIETGVLNPSNIKDTDFMTQSLKLKNYLIEIIKFQTIINNKYITSLPESLQLLIDQELKIKLKSGIKEDIYNVVKYPDINISSLLEKTVTNYKYYSNELLEELCDILITNFNVNRTINKWFIDNILHQEYLFSNPGTFIDKQNTQEFKQESYQEGYDDNDPAEVEETAGENFIEDFAENFDVEKVEDIWDVD